MFMLFEKKQQQMIKRRQFLKNCYVISFKSIEEKAEANTTLFKVTVHFQ